MNWCSLARSWGWLVLAGIAMICRAPDLRIIDLQPVGTNHTWRLRWNSTPGADYQLQRAKDDRLITGNDADWLPLLTLRATNSLTVVDDPAGPLVAQRFYRVVQFTNTVADLQPPAISYVGVEAASTFNGSSALRVRFIAGDNVGVSSVTIREGSITLGQATPTGGSNWVFLVPAAVGNFQARLFTGIASDPSGNTAQATGGVLVSDPDRFVPLDIDGRLREGRFLSAITTNQAGPFVYRPGGRSRPGAAPDFFLNFPDGATFLQVTNRTVMQFIRVNAGFETNSPFRFVSAPQRNGGPGKQLVVGPLGFDDLSGVFDLSVTNDFALTVFNRFPVRWRGGSIDDRGLPGAQFLPQLASFPLPGWSQALPGLLIDFARERTLRLPLAGTFALPDGSSNSPSLRVGNGNPLWLALRADGHISLEGPVEVGWANGQNVRAQLLFDDPKYCLELEASSLKISAASNLVDLLPNNPAGCIPGVATPAQLLQATKCLDAYARAFQNFSALVASSASNAPASAAEPPDGLNVASAALEAWGFSASAGTAQSLPLDSIATLMQQFGHQAGAAPELPEVLANRRALMRARAAIQIGAAIGNFNTRSGLDAALAEAEAAALDRVRNPDAVLSLASMKQAARILLDTEAQRQITGLPAGPLLAELPGLFQRFSDRLADRFSVKANVFTPAANPSISGLNRFVVIEMLRDLVDVQANAQLLGVNLASTRLDELSGQLGVQLLQTVNASLGVAEAGVQLPAFTLAAQDFVELSGWVQLGLFPSVPALAPLGDGSALASLGSRLNALSLLELDRPFSDKTLGRQAHEVRALLNVLRQMPGTVTFAAPPIRRAYDKLEERLNLAANTTALAVVTNQIELLELIEAGTLHRELGARFAFPQPVNWETNRLPLVVTRFAQLATARRGWRELDQAVRQLINAADRAGLMNDQNLRRANLQQAAVLLAASRNVARSLLQDATGALRVLDFALPGDIVIVNPAGHACYNRFSREFHGSVRGGLQLPKWGLSLTVPNASFGNDGRFDISAFGSLNFNGGQLSVPARQPVHVWNSSAHGIAMEGGARLTLTNGMRFDASVSLRDPDYCFSLSARGLEFDVGKQLILQRPTLAPNALNNFSDAARDAFSDYLGALSGSFETLANAAGSFPPVDESGFGRPPEFTPPEIKVDLSPLRAWSGAIIAASAAGLSNSAVGLNEAIASLERLNQEARAASNALSVDISQLVKLAERMEVQRQLKIAADKAAQQQLAGSGDLTRLNGVLLTGARLNASNILSLITPDLPDRLADSLDVMRLIFGSEANLQELNSDGGTNGFTGDPCIAVTSSALGLFARAEALASCAAQRQALRFGLNPVTGVIANTNLFNSLGELDLFRVVRVLIAADVELQLQNAASAGDLLQLVEPMLVRQADLLFLQFTNNPGLTLARRIELAHLLIGNAESRRLSGDTNVNPAALIVFLEETLSAGLAGVSSAELDRAKKEADESIRRRNQQLKSDLEVAIGSNRRMQVIAPDEDYQPDFLTQLNNYFRVVGLPVPPGIATNLESYVRFKAQELRARPFTPEFLTNRLGEAQTLLSGVIGLTDWASARMPTDFSTLTNLQFTVSNLTFSVTVVSEAQKAWWLIERYDEALRLHASIYGTNLNVGISNSLTQARNATLLAGNRVATALVTLVNAVGTADVIVPLPGNVVIESIYGKLCFDRQTGFMDGCFGGRVEFPDVNTNLFFEITEACLNSDLSYHVAGLMGTPLPFGQTRLQAGLDIAGSPAGVATVTGNGTLFVPNPPSGERSFSVTLGYNQPARRLSFDAQGNNLDLRLSEDFVLFGAGFGFDLTTALPQGSFRVNGSAGMFAKAKPLPLTVGPTNFHLSADNLTTVFAWSSNLFAVSLSNGTIRLPDFFHNGLCTTNGGQSATGPAIALVPASPITVSIGTGANPSASFNGALDFRRLGFNVPGLTNLGVEICSARLLFRSNALPCFSNLNATLSIPLPNQTSIVDLTGVEWCVDGFPTAGSIGLRQGLRLFDAGGLAFDFQTNSAFGFSTSLNGNLRTTVFTLSGGLRGTFDGDLLFDPQSNAAFSFGTSGSFRWQTDQLPSMALDSLTFAGRMKIGGVNGFELLGVDANGIPDVANTNSQASISLIGLTNLFELATNRTLEVNVSGAMGSADFVFFGLGNARFVFDGAPPEPQFTVQSLGFREGNQLKLLGQSLLPFRITAGSIAFLNPARPLNQLFAPENLRFTFSGVVDISLAPPDSNEPGSLPRLFGAVDNVQVTLPSGFSGPPQFSVNTFALSLENLTIGDMAGLSGGLIVGNLNTPEDLYFAGTVGGGYNGVGIKAIVATRLDGLLGLCLSVNAGAAGIPLDGGTLGGILLTGAEGGVSFLNSFSDPCDFKSFLGLTDSGEPAAAPIQAASATGLRAAPGPRVSQLRVLGWNQLDRFQKLHQQRKALMASLGNNFANESLAVRAPLTQSVFTAASGPVVVAAGGGAGANVPCPTGDCPPATLNLLCQRHPSVAEGPSAANYDGAYRERVIFKFTSLGRETVDDILAAVNIDLNGSSAVVAANFADAARDFVNGLIPRAPAGMPADQAQQINEFIDTSVAAMRDSVAGAVQLAFQSAAPGRAPLDVLYEVAYAGVPCVDVTIQLKGTFSYAPVSVALSATGGAVASTTGSAGILGSVNLFGLPVGTGEFFYSLTDTNGNPNPSLCGGAGAALGPLELGQMGLAIGCDECVTGTMLAMFNFVQGLSGDIATQAGPIIYSFIEHAAGHRLTGIRGRPLTAYFGPTGALLTQQEQVAVMTALLNLPEVVRFLQSNPGAVSEFGNDAVLALGNRVIGLILEIYNSTNPRLQFCGEVEPKIFGFSLTGGNTLVAARLFADKTNLRGDATFSPSYVFGNMPFFLLSGGAVNNVVPALDEATMGFSLGLPLVNEATLRQLGTNPAGFASTQVNHLLANATMTFGYELSPFGFKLADGEGRIILPTLENHPDNPARRAAHPGDYVNGKFRAPVLPDRLTLIKATLDSNVLAQATWAGRGPDLAALFLAGSAEANAVASRELVRDYFPHGGFLGAAKAQFPKPITDAPPFAQLAELFSPLSLTNALDRLTLAQDIFQNYVMGSREIGRFSIYVPFPNPPASFWAAAQGPQAFIDTIAASDLESLVSQGLNLYPAEQFFMRGDVQAQILGLALGQGELVAVPGEGLFRLSFGIPTGSWLTNFVRVAVTGEVRTAEYILATNPNELPPGVTAADLQPGARLTNALNSLLAAAQPGTSDAARNLAISNAIARITDTLPKASLSAEMNLRLPTNLSSLVRFNSGAGFFGFSPRFEPGYALPGYVGTILFPDPDAGNPGPYTLARRNGGLVAAGNFTFGFNLSDPDPNKRLLIEVPQVALGLTGTDNPSLFPSLNGLIAVSNIALPNLFSFAGNSSPGFQFKDGLMQFNSNPGIGADFIHVRGKMSPIDLGPFLKVRPLPAEANPQNLLGGSLRVTKTAGGSSMAMSLNPADAVIPMFGPNLHGMIYGSFSNGLFTPFTFSTIPGQSWAATVRLTGAVEIRSPLDPNGPVLFRAEPLASGGNPVPFEAQFNGVGLQQFEIRLTVPNGVEFTLFPGTGHESVYKTGSESATCLFVSSDGRVYFDSGTRTLDLNGLASVRGRIEFGFEPVDRRPALGRSSVANFIARLGGSHEQVITVTNTNTAGSQLTLDAVVSEQTIFSVLPNRLLLGPGQSAPLRVRFTPRTAGTFARTLTLSNNSAVSNIQIALTGIVSVAPRMHLNASSISFGATPLGTTKGQAVRVSNLGDSALFLTNATTTTSPFKDDAPSLVNIPAGGFRDIMVSFTPPSLSSANGLLTFTSNDPLVPASQVSLTGFGSSRFWYRQRRGDGMEHLKDIVMNSDGRGIAVGLDGAAYDAESDGRLWRADFFPGGTNLLATVFQTFRIGWVTGERGLAFKTTDGTNWTRVTHSALAKNNTSWRAAALLSPGTGGLVVAGETAGSGAVVFESGGGSFTAGVVPASTPPLNGVVLGTTSIGIAVGDNATILRTADGAKSWSKINAPASIASTIEFRAVAVNPTNPAAYVIVGDTGVILQSTDAGLNWTVRGSNSVNLLAVAHAPDAFYAVGENGAVRRGISNGGLWVTDDAGTSNDFRGVTTRGAEVWAVSAQGGIFHRRTSAISGPISVVNAEDLRFDQVAEGELVVREIVISNEGTTNLTAGLNLSSLDSNFSIFPKTNIVVPPGCEGLFTVSYQNTKDGSSKGSITVDTSDNSDGKIEAATTVTVKGKDFTPLAYAHLPRCIHLGSLFVGGSARFEIGITNRGQSVLNLQEVSVRSDDTSPITELTPLFSKPLEVGEGGVIQFEFKPTRAGLHRGQIEVTSDAANGVALIDFVADVVALPRVVVIDSAPHGAAVVVNSTTVTTPAAFSIVTGIAGAGQLLFGSTVNVRAANSFTADGVPYAFQRWEPGAGTNLTFTAGSNVVKYVARYAQGLNSGSAGSVPPAFIASPCSFAPPTDVPFGPWVKITQARMTLPWLTEGGTTNGTPFKVEGALFLSLQKAYGSLSSGRIRTVVPANSPAFANAELLEITAGSWNFDVESGFFKLSALSPGVQVLNTSALPPSNLRIEVDVRPGSNDPHAYARFATLDELPLVPGLLAFGPSSAEVRVGFNPASPDLRLALSGNLRALARPGSTGWIIDRTHSLVFDPALPSLAPVTFASRQLLADLALLRVHSTNGTQIGPTFNGTTFGLIASNLDLEFFQNGQFIRSSTSVSSDGTFSFAATLPTAGIGVGLVQFRPQSSGARTASILANPLQARLAVTFPDMFVNSSGSLWPDNGFELPGFSFNSAEFSLRMTVPSIDFAKLPLEKKGSIDEDNYFEFTRRPTETRLKLRNRQDLFLGALKLGWSVSSNGELSGHLSGRLGLEGPSPLDAVSDRVSIGFRSSPAPEFILNRYFLGVPTRLKVGSNLPFVGKACLLDVFTDDPLANRSESLCLP